jgi:hypothetical protein
VTEPESDPRPWEQPGAVRRDCRPHRGPWLLMLSGLGLLLAPLLLALPLCAAGWVLAGRELIGMEAGLIDPEGEDAAVRARKLAFAGLLLALAALVPGCVTLSFIMSLSMPF